MGSSSTTSLPAPLLPAHLTICCTSSFMHYQFTPTSPRVESCPAQMYSRVQGCNSKPFIMWLLPHQVYNPCRIGYERRGEQRRGGCTKKERPVLTCTMCASGSVLTVKDKTEEKAGQYRSNVMHLIWILSSFRCWENNHWGRRWMQRTIFCLCIEVFGAVWAELTALMETQ